MSRISCMTCVDGKHNRCDGCDRLRLVTIVESLPKEVRDGFVNRLEAFVEGARKASAESIAHLQESEQDIQHP